MCRSLFWHCVALLAAFLGSSAAAQTGGQGLQALPREVRDEVARIRKACTELYPAYAPKTEMQGLQFVKLEDRAAIIVDNLELCSDHVPAANCSNRGCDLAIWVQDKNGAWRQVFKEHLYAKTIRIDRASGRLDSMSVAVYAGHAWCRPKPNRQYTSGQSCNLTIRYAGGKWIARAAP
jgi:hypothetical protein